MTDLAQQHTLRAGSAAELVKAVERAVGSGELAPGAPLPSVRSLARQLGLSPVTVAAGLGELRRRGVVVTEQRRGSRIGDGPPLGLRRTPLSAPAGVRDLSVGNPDPELLPDIRGALGALPGVPRLYGEPAVLPALAKLARERLRGEGVAAEHLCVAGGALDAIERVLQANLRPGDRVAVEDPGYVALYDLLRAAGLRLEPVAIDERGMLPGALRGALAAGASAVIITPRAQNPTGSACDEERAEALRAALAEHPDALLVEDDHLGPVAGVPLYTLTPGRAHWAFTGSVAKALGPDLRLALLCGDEATIDRVQGRQQCGPGWVSHILQRLACELLGDEAVEGQVARAAEAYRERRERLLSELGTRGISAVARSGLNVWIEVPEESSVVAGLLQRGFLVAAGAPYRLSPGQAAIRVTVSSMRGGEAAELAGALADVLAAGEAGAGARRG